MAEFFTDDTNTKQVELLAATILENGVFWTTFIFLIRFVLLLADEHRFGIAYLTQKLFLAQSVKLCLFMIIIWDTDIRLVGMLLLFYHVAL